MTIVPSGAAASAFMPCIPCAGTTQTRCAAPGVMPLPRMYLDYRERAMPRPEIAAPLAKSSPAARTVTSGEGQGAMEYESFATLVSPHTAAMIHMASALVGQADAEDAAQEALVRAWHNWSTLRDPNALRSWLLRITYNVCLNWRAGRFGTSRRLTEPLGDGSAFPHFVARAGPGTGDHAAALDLRAAVAALDDDLRPIVVLRFYVGMDATEIGAVLGTPPATVRTRLRRALLTLRDRLGSSANLSIPPTRERGH